MDQASECLNQASESSHIHYNASEFPICIQNKSHMILCMIQQTYAHVRFSECISE